MRTAVAMGVPLAIGAATDVATAVHSTTGSAATRRAGLRGALHLRRFEQRAPALGSRGRLPPHRGGAWRCGGQADWRAPGQLRGDARDRRRWACRRSFDPHPRDRSWAVRRALRRLLTLALGTGDTRARYALQYPLTNLPAAAAQYEHPARTRLGGLVEW